MKLKLNFGIAHWRETDWWQPIAFFPTLLTFRTVKYELSAFDEDPTGRYDQILNFAEIQSWDPAYSVTSDAFESRFESESTKCECGANYSPFQFDHMRMCRQWKPWGLV